MNSLQEAQSIVEMVIADYTRLNKQLCSRITARCPAEFEANRLLLWYMYQMTN